MHQWIVSDRRADAPGPGAPELGTTNSERVEAVAFEGSKVSGVSYDD